MGLLNLADWVISEYIGLYLDDNPESYWENILEQLMNQYNDYTSSTDVARTLVSLKQKEGETCSELASRVLRLTKIGYKGRWCRHSRLSII